MTNSVVPGVRRHTYICSISSPLMEDRNQAGQLRWRLVESEESGMLFSESALGERHVGTGSTGAWSSST